MSKLHHSINIFKTVSDRSWSIILNISIKSQSFFPRLRYHRKRLIIDFVLTMNKWKGVTSCARFALPDLPRSAVIFGGVMIQSLVVFCPCLSFRRLKSLPCMALNISLLLSSVKCPLIFSFSYEAYWLNAWKSDNNINENSPVLLIFLGILTDFIFICPFLPWLNRR